MSERTFMVIEHIRDGELGSVYERLAARGRMLPEGLLYVDSWLAADGDRCFQLMKTEDPVLFEQWTAQWTDLVDFEIVEIGAKPGSG